MDEMSVLRRQIKFFRDTCEEHKLDFELSPKVDVLQSCHQIAVDTSSASKIDKLNEIDDRLLLRVDYCGVDLTFQIIFDTPDMAFPPDVVLLGKAADICEDIDADHVPTMLNWSPRESALFELGCDLASSVRLRQIQALQTIKSTWFAFNWDTVKRDCTLDGYVASTSPPEVILRKRFSRPDTTWWLTMTLRPESKNKFAHWTLLSGEGERDLKLQLGRETTIVEAFRAVQRRLDWRQKQRREALAAITELLPFAIEVDTDAYRRATYLLETTSMTATDRRAKRFACVLTVELAAMFPYAAPSFRLRAVGNGDREHDVGVLPAHSTAWRAHTLANECHAFLWEQVHKFRVECNAEARRRDSLPDTSPTHPESHHAQVDSVALDASPEPSAPSGQHVVDLSEL